jgi:outer membrane lipase/esterase
LGLEARGDFEGGGVGLRPFVSAMLEKDFAGNGRTAFFSQTTSPTIVNRWDLGERSEDIYGRVSGGASAAVLPGAKLNALVSSTFGKDDGNEVSAHLGVSLGF